MSLVNAAFAMEWDFISRDRTDAAEIAHYLETGTFFVVDGEAGALGACMYLEPRGDRRSLRTLAVAPSRRGRGPGR